MVMRSLHGRDKTVYRSRGIIIYFCLLYQFTVWCICIHASRLFHFKTFVHIVLLIYNACVLYAYILKEAAAAAKQLMSGLVKGFLYVLWFKISCIINEITLGQFG